MRSTTNLLIINLADADILFVIFCVPFTATDYVLPEWPFGDLWCKVVSLMDLNFINESNQKFLCFLFLTICSKWLFIKFHPYNIFVCLQVQYMIVVTCHASVYTLVLMSFDRFLAVVHPVTSMSLRTERNATL